MAIGGAEAWPEIAIVGCVRDGARRLPAAVARLAAAFAPARRLHWLVVESDSGDATPAVLARLAREVPDFRYRALGPLAERLPQRTERLAHCRNLCREAVAADPELAGAELVVVADLDGVNARLTTGAAASCFARADWDAVFANQAGPYYDIWALRHPDWSPNDCWQQHRALTELGGADYASAWRTAVGGRMICLRPDAAWIPVESAFGGLAIYRRAAFLAGRYSGTEGGAEVCEHVPFHADLRRAGARLFINPALVNAAYTEHSRPLAPLRRVLGAPRALARRLLNLARRAR